jgi:hypothetical protein
VRNRIEEKFPEIEKGPNVVAEAFLVVASGIPQSPRTGSFGMTCVGSMSFR